MENNKIKDEVKEKQSNKENSDNMRVKVLNIKDGLKLYQDVHCIRINHQSEKLIIMKDYMPIIGEVNGEVIIEMKDETVKLSNIIGYYMNYQNQFNLFLKEE